MALESVLHCNNRGCTVTIVFNQRLYLHNTERGNIALSAHRSPVSSKGGTCNVSTRCRIHIRHSIQRHFVNNAELL